MTSRPSGDCSTRDQGGDAVAPALPVASSGRARVVWDGGWLKRPLLAKTVRVAPSAAGSESGRIGNLNPQSVLKKKQPAPEGSEIRAPGVA